MSSTEDSLTRLDAVAAALVERAGPVLIRLADSAEDVRTAQRVRAQALLERGRATANELPAGLEIADGDERAVHMLAELDGVAIGTGRLIFPEPGRVLPMEVRPGAARMPRRCVEFGRLATVGHPAARHGSVLPGLIGAAWLQVRARGEQRICGTVSRAMLRLYERLGFILEVVGPEVELLGEPHVPIVFEPSADVAAAAETGRTIP